MDLVQTEVPETRVPTRSGRQWSILQVMVVIAGLAPLLALARYPFVFGLVAFVGSIILFVALCIRRRRYDLVAWLLILYPVLPLLVLYTHWSLAIRKIIRRSTPLFDGLIGLSDACAYFCIVAYFGCIAIVVGRWAQKAPEIRRAAKWVVFVMPVTWIALFAFAIWDPFGMLGYFFRF
jgi:hypothetical protein